MLPNFIIIGVQRGGTTSLYKYLTKHPKIIPAIKKEIHFFDNNFHKGISWYQSQFKQNRLLMLLYKKKKFYDSITGEATPYYIYHPYGVERISKLIPNVKLIILLRNPVERAYSHYQHELRLKVEKISFEDALKQESNRLEGEIEKMLEDETYYSFNHKHFSYLSLALQIPLTAYLSSRPKVVTVERAAFVLVKILLDYIEMMESLDSSRNFL